MPSSHSVNTTEPFTIKWQDPRQIDGEPAEAAKAAVQQLHDLTVLMREAIPPAVAMIRNASMSEGLAWNNDNDPAKWWDESEQKNHVDVALSRLNALTEWAERIVRVGGH
jgi:hypothetical protein